MDYPEACDSPTKLRALAEQLKQTFGDLPYWKRQAQPEAAAYPGGAMKVAILDDYQNRSLTLADWSAVARRAEITVFSDHLAAPDAVIERLRPFGVLCVMRERTPLPRAILEQLPRLKLIVSTGRRNASIDLTAAEEHGIRVAPTGYSATPTIEMTWALILASARHIAGESHAVRQGRWQSTIGRELSGRVLGVLGLGNIGTPVARIGRAFGMSVVAWSQNMTPEIATAAGATLVSKHDLFSRADWLTIHLVLSQRTRGLVGAAELAEMQPTAWLVNTSRGSIVDQAALIDALTTRRICGAALDVFEVEPLPGEHPFRTLDNVLATPHIGYVAEDLYRTFYGDAAATIAAWLEAHPEF